MKSDKIPLSVNKELKADAAELAEVLGIPGIYGWFPQVVKFSICFTLESLKAQEKVIPALEPDKLDTYFQAIARLRKIKRHKDFDLIYCDIECLAKGQTYLEDGVHEVWYMLDEMGRYELMPPEFKVEVFG